MHTVQKLPQCRPAPQDPSPTHRSSTCLRPVGVRCNCGGTRAEQGLAPYMAPGTRLHAPHLGNTPFPSPQTPCIHRLPQACALFSILPRNCHSAIGAHKTHVSPIGTACASDLWRFCARRVSIPYLQTSS